MGNPIDLSRSECDPSINLVPEAYYNEVVVLKDMFTDMSFWFGQNRSHHKSYASFWIDGKATRLKMIKRRQLIPESTAAEGAPI